MRKWIQACLTLGTVTFLTACSGATDPLAPPTEAPDRTLQPAGHGYDPVTDTCYGMAATVVGNNGTNGDDVIIGTPGDDVLRGYNGNDRICGRGGNDTVLGGGGDDLLSGDDGNDTINGGAGSDILHGIEGDDTLNGHLGSDNVLGGPGNDTINGGKHDDHLKGNTGDDTMSGDEGNDYVEGGQGDDSVEGNDGDDTLKGKSGADAHSGGPGNDAAIGFDCDAGDTDDGTTENVEPCDVPDVAGTWSVENAVEESDSCDGFTQEDLEEFEESAELILTQTGTRVFLDGEEGILDSSGHAEFIVVASDAILTLTLEFSGNEYSGSFRVEITDGEDAGCVVIISFSGRRIVV